MAYRIEGLERDAYAGLLGLTDTQLAEHAACRVTAHAKPGFPCRVTLEDAEPGESLILFNHVSHDVPTPFRTAYAIFVREQAGEAAVFVDRLPPVLQQRMLSLRGFDRAGMLREAVLAEPGEAEERIGALLADPAVASIHAHTPAHGCFLARIERN